MLVVNCDVCDARKVNEESLSGYSQIVLNTDLLLVDENSRAVLNRLPVVCNADAVLDAEGEISIVTANGDYEISGGTLAGGKAVISVNGNLTVRPGTEKVMENILRICVNGSARYPESMAPFMDRLSVNGDVRCIPDGCIELKPVFVIDKYFPLRARQGGKYYAEQKVILADTDVDVEALAGKKVRFVTDYFLVREELAPQAVAMFDESVEMDVIPSDMAYIGDGARLNEALVLKYGKRLYIDGDLTLEDESENCFGMVEKLWVNGDVRLFKRQEEAFARVDAVYGKLVFVKGRYVANQARMVVDTGTLEALPDGLEIGNCATLIVEKEVKPELIMEKLAVRNCARIFCSPEQRGALQLVCANVAKIEDGEMPEDGEHGEGGSRDGTENAGNHRVVNTDSYIL